MTELYVTLQCKILSVVQLLWQVQVAGNEKTYFGLHKCPIFLSDFKHIWSF